MATLYIVATPIGNMEDITLRAIRTLKEVDMVLCEDTRVTRKILGHYEISTPTLSYHEHSGSNKIDQIISLLEEGKDLALVTDAGTPGISDPGAYLVQQVRERLPEVNISPIPGPSALSAILSVSGIRAKEISFLGFLPHKKGRETSLSMIAESDHPIVIYESTHRILKTLKCLVEKCPEKSVLLGRELTKKFEELVVGTPAKVLDELEGNIERQKGEFVLIIY